MKYLALPLITLLNILCLTTSGQQKRAFQMAVGIGGIGGEQHDGLLFNFEPRVNLYEFSNKSSLSIGASIGFGPTGANDHTTTQRTWEPRHFRIRPGQMFNLPLTVNYTFGNGATPRAYSLFGGSAGIGYAYHYATRFVDPGPGIDTTRVRAHGLICDAKFNFPLGNSSWSVHAAYMFNFSHNNPDLPSINSVSLQYTIGYPIFNRETRKQRHYEHDRAYYREIDRQKKAEIKNKRKQARSEKKETT